MSPELNVVGTDRIDSVSSMVSISIKQKVLEAVQRLPPDATIGDAIERLYFLAKVERGVAQADAGETLPHEAARKRLLK